MTVPSAKIILALIISICIIIVTLWLSGVVKYDRQTQKAFKKINLSDWLADTAFELCIGSLIIMGFIGLVWIVGKVIGVDIFNSVNYQQI